MSTAPVMPIVPPYTPELLPVVQSWITAHLEDSPRRRILEFGAGWSTIWFAQMACEVVSLEHDLGWWREVKNVLDTLWPHRASVLLASPQSFPWFAHQVPDDGFDLVLVDCIDEQRLPCLEVSRSKIRPGGWLVVDDTHWESLKPAFALLAGWSYEQFDGEHVRKTGQTHYHHTTIFERPA